MTYAPAVQMAHPGERVERPRQVDHLLGLGERNGRPIILVTQPHVMNQVFVSGQVTCLAQRRRRGDYRRRRQIAGPGGYVKQHQLHVLNLGRQELCIGQQVVGNDIGR